MTKKEVAEGVITELLTHVEFSEEPMSSRDFIDCPMCYETVPEYGVMDYGDDFNIQKWSDEDRYLTELLVNLVSRMGCKTCIDAFKLLPTQDHLDRILAALYIRV